MLGTLDKLPGNNPLTTGPDRAPVLADSDPPTLFSNPTAYTGKAPPPGVEVLANQPRVLEGFSGWVYDDCYSVRLSLFGVLPDRLTEQRMCCRTSSTAVRFPMASGQRTTRSRRACSLAPRRPTPSAAYVCPSLLPGTTAEHKSRSSTMESAGAPTSSQAAQRRSATATVTLRATTTRSSTAAAVTLQPWSCTASRAATLASSPTAPRRHPSRPRPLNPPQPPRLPRR